MGVLNRKLWRDLVEMRGMVLAIALVQVGGIATFVMSLSTYDTLLIARDSYYREQRFADVFALLKRAPDTLAGRLQAVPGVDPQGVASGNDQRLLLGDVAALVVADLLQRHPGDGREVGIR